MLIKTDNTAKMHYLFTVDAYMENKTNRRMLLLPLFLFCLLNRLKTRHGSTYKRFLLIFFFFSFFSLFFLLIFFSKSDSQTTHAILPTHTVSLLLGTKSRTGCKACAWQLYIDKICSTAIVKHSCGFSNLDLLESREMTSGEPGKQCNHYKL